MALMLGQNRQQSQNCLIRTFKTQKKHNRYREKLLNFRNLVLLKGSTFHLKDKKSYKGTLNDLSITMPITNQVFTAVAKC